MRKLLLLSVLTVFSVFRAQSQESTPTTQDKFRFGLHFSPNIGWIKPDTDSLSSGGSRIGFSYGLVTDFNFGERYAFSTGISIVKNGGILKSTNGTETIVSTQYIQIPAIMKLKTNEIGYFTYFAKFGFTPDINIKAKSEVSGNDIDFKNQIQPFRIGLLLGAGAEYNISGDTRIIFGADFNNGFTGILTKKAGTEANGDRYKAISNYVNLSLGVAF